MWRYWSLYGEDRHCDAVFLYVFLVQCSGRPKSGRYVKIGGRSGLSSGFPCMDAPYRTITFLGFEIRSTSNKGVECSVMYVLVVATRVVEYSVRIFNLRRIGSLT